MKRNPNYRRGFFRQLDKLTIRFLDLMSRCVQGRRWHIITTHAFLGRVWVPGKGYDSAIPLQRWDALMKTNLYREEAVRSTAAPFRPSPLVAPANAKCTRW